MIVKTKKRKPTFPAVNGVTRGEQHRRRQALIESRKATKENRQSFGSYVIGFLEIAGLFLAISFPIMILFLWAVDHAK